MAHSARKASGQTFDDLSRCETLTCCLVCMEAYDKPRLLHCGHVFCHRCLVRHSKTYHPDNTTTTTILCPTCQSQTQVPPTGLEALGLDQTDTKPKLRRISVTAMGSTTQYCDTCESRQVKAEAEFYCNKCCMDMCTNCKLVHEQHAVLKSHGLLHISNKDSMNLYCSRPSHNKAPCLYFCVSCNTPVCCVCIIIEHDSHHTSKLTDAITTRRDNLKTLLNSVGPRVEKFGSRLRKLIHICATSKPPNKPRAGVNGSPPSPVINGNDLEMVAISTRKDSNDNLDLEIRAMYTEIEKLHRLYEISSKILDNTQSRKLLVVYDELMTRLQSVRDVELDVINDALVTKLEHEIGVTDGNHVNSHQISPGTSTGSIADKHVPGTASNSSTPRHSNASQEDSYCDSADQFMLFKPKLVWKLEKTRQDPGELWNPAAVAFRPDRGIVVSEYDIMNDKNNRLRLFDEQGASQGVIAQGQIKPLGVACNRDGNFAVADCDGKRIKVFNRDGHMVQEIGKGQFGWPYGITCNSKGHYIVSDPFHDTIHIFNHDGRKVKSFGSSGSQNTQFKNPFHVSVDSRDNIIISDSGNNCVKVFDPQGTFMYMSSNAQRGRVNEVSRHKQKSSKLKGPRGVAVDMKDNIVVADDCGRICLLDHLGKYVRNLLTEEDTIKYPEAVATSHNGLLAVTEWNSNNMFAVKVFNMYE